MTRLKRKFAELEAASRKALIPFVTAGDPRWTQPAKGSCRDCVFAPSPSRGGLGWGWC